MSDTIKLHSTTRTVLHFIWRFKEMNDGLPPTQREIQARLKVKSKNTVRHHIGLLEAADLVKRRKPGNARNLSITSKGRTLLGVA